MIVVLSLLAIGCPDSAKKVAPPSKSPEASNGSGTKKGIVRNTERAPKPEPGEKSGPIWFAEKTHDSGITFKVETGSKEKLYLVETIGQGVMLFDYDRDGDLDLYFANGGELRSEPTGRIYWNGLWRNDGNWSFSDQTEGSGLECPEWSVGVYAVDFDLDGFEDVYVTQLGKNRFFKNLGGTGKFAEMTDTWGGGCEKYSTSAAFFDADQDGDLDLFVCNYVEFDIKNPPNKGFPCRWKELETCCGPRGLGEEDNVFYENVDGKLVEATEKFGFKEPKMGTYSLGVVTSDFDMDGDQDVFVAVDSRANLCFENLGRGKFKNVAPIWQVAVNAEGLEQACMGTTAADLDENGYPDIVVTNFSHDTNTIYLNAGKPKNMYFTDVTNACGMGGEASYPWLSWAVGAHDYDCDGALDLMIASGHVYAQAEGVRNLGTSYNQPCQLFMGTPGEVKYRDVAKSAGPALKRLKSSRGAAFGDIDQDGRIDAVIANLDDFPTLARNECDIVGEWTGIELLDEKSKNPRAVGARVVFKFADGKSHLREVTGGDGYLGSSEKTVHFAWAKDRTMEKLTVRWPDGATEEIPAPLPNRYYVLKRGSGKLVERQGAIRR